MNLIKLLVTLFLAITASAPGFADGSKGVEGKVIKVEQYFAKSEDGSEILKTPLQIDRTVVAEGKFKGVSDIYDFAVDLAKSSDFIRFDTVKLSAEYVDAMNEKHRTAHDPNNSWVRAIIVTSYEWELEDGIIRNSKGFVNAHSRKAEPATGNKRQFRSGKSYDGTGASLARNLFSPAKDGSVSAQQAQEIARTTGLFTGAVASDPNSTEVIVDPAPEDEKAPADMSKHIKAYEVMSWGCGGNMTWDCAWDTEGKFTSLKEARRRLGDVEAEHKLIRTIYVQANQITIWSDWRIGDRTYQTFFVE